MANRLNRTLTANGIGISLLDTGSSGMPVVFLHGSGGSKEVFARQFGDPSLQGYRLVAIDLPGHGGSANAPDAATYRFTGLAGIVAAVLDQLGIREPVVAGWSLGGHVAIEMAACGHALSGLVLFGTPPLSRGPFSFLSAFQPKLDMLLATKPVFSSQDAERFATLIYGRSLDADLLDGVIRADGRCRAEIARATFRAEGSDQRRFLEKSRIPVAIVNGANDPLLRLKYFSKVHFGNLWREQAFEIAGAGHAPFLDRPHEFDALLGEFAHDVATGQAYKHFKRAG